MCYQNCAKTIYQSLTRAFLCKLQNLACYKSFLFGTPIHRLLIDRFPFWKTRNNSSNHLVPNLPTIHVVTTHLGLQPASHVHKMSASSRQRSGARNEALSTSSRKLTLQRVPKSIQFTLIDVSDASFRKTLFSTKGDCFTQIAKTFVKAGPARWTAAIKNFHYQILFAGEGILWVCVAAFVAHV